MGFWRLLVKGAPTERLSGSHPFDIPKSTARGVGGLKLREFHLNYDPMLSQLRPMVLSHYVFLIKNYFSYTYK